MTSAFLALHHTLGSSDSAFLVGSVAIFISLIAGWTLKDGFEKKSGFYRVNFFESPTTSLIFFKVGSSRAVDEGSGFTQTVCPARTTNPVNIIVCISRQNQS